MDVHGPAAAHKPNITMRDTKPWLGRCKAHCGWTLEQWKCLVWSDKSRFTIWQSDVQTGFGIIKSREHCLPECTVPTVWCWMSNGLRQFFMIWAKPLSSN